MPPHTLYTDTVSTVARFDSFNPDFKISKGHKSTAVKLQITHALPPSYKLGCISLSYVEQKHFLCSSGTEFRHRCWLLASSCGIEAEAVLLLSRLTSVSHFSFMWHQAIHILQKGPQVCRLQKWSSAGTLQVSSPAGAMSL